MFRQRKVGQSRGSAREGLRGCPGGEGTGWDACGEQVLLGVREYETVLCRELSAGRGKAT